MDLFSLLIISPANGSTESLNEILKIQGGSSLFGKVKASGAKNAITKMLVASLLSDKKCIFDNVPNILEVETTVALFKELGSHISWDRENGIIEIQTKDLTSTYIPQRFSGANRIPILLIGALLGRTSEDIIVPTAGGCNIGKRPVDFHIKALEALGATIEYRKMKKEGAYFAHAHNGLKGTIITLDYPSVGATENTILAACRAKGKTVIKNAAIEPEIIDQVLFLQKFGVNIHLDTNRQIIIQETSLFKEVRHTVITDRIEAASFGMAAIATRGKVLVEGADQLHMISLLNKIRDIGADFTVSKEGISFFSDGPLKSGIHLETDVHPGFLTDWQQPFAILLTQAKGSSVLHETVYENRFGYLSTLKEMGADVELFTQCLGGKKCRFAGENYRHSVVVKGPTLLKGQTIEIPDLRAGFAYVLAALAAEGNSEIHNLKFLDRGYENIDSKLASLGANITRIKKSEDSSVELCQQIRDAKEKKQELSKKGY